MNKLLIIIDMQNDFITGSLSNKEAQLIVNPMVEFIKTWDGNIYCTLDTHNKEDYFKSQEGKKLPVLHCVHNTNGWAMEPGVFRAICKHQNSYCYMKEQFGYNWNTNIPIIKEYDEIYVCGTCTDICVISNVLILKSALPETPIYVIENLCAGTTAENHKKAIDIMKSCQVNII